MALWTPNNSEATNSGSLVFWIDADNTSGYRLDGGTRTDENIGTSNTLDVIYNLGTSGSILGPSNASYPATLITGTLDPAVNKNGFRFGYKPAGSFFVSTPFTSSIFPPINNDDRFIISVTSRMMINTYPSVAGFKSFYGYGSLFGSSTPGMSILGDTNTDNNSPFASFGTTNLFPSTTNLIDETDVALIGFVHDSSDDSNNLYLSGSGIANSTLTLTTNGSGDGMALGSNYANDNADVTIHELLVYSIADTETTQSGEDANFRETVEGYLAHKWGIEGQLPSDHPYKSAAPQIGGGGGGSFPNPQSSPQGNRYTVELVDNQMSQLVTQYDRGANQEAYVPFRLSVRGPSNLRLRPSNKVYKITKD